MNQELKIPEHIERAFDKKYAFFLICFILFIDILCNIFWGRNISSLSRNDFQANITIGTIALVIAAYLVFMSIIMPMIIFVIQQTFLLCGGGKRNIPTELGWMSLYKLEEYAQKHNSTILFEQIKQKKNYNYRSKLLADLKLSASVLFLIDVFFKNSICFKGFTLALNYPFSLACFFL